MIAALALWTALSLSLGIAAGSIIHHADTLQQLANADGAEGSNIIIHEGAFDR